MNMKTFNVVVQCDTPDELARVLLLASQKVKDEVFSFDEMEVDDAAEVDTLDDTRASINRSE